MATMTPNHDWELVNLDRPTDAQYIYGRIVISPPKLCNSIPGNHYRAVHYGTGQTYYGSADADGFCEMQARE